MPFLRYVGKKARDLLIPYVVFSLLGFLLMLIFPDDWRVQGSVKDYLVHYLYLTHPFALGAGWFLVCLFFSSIILYIVLHVWSGKNALHLIPVAVCFAVAGAFLYELVTAKHFGRLPWKLDSAVMAVSFMLFGFIFREKACFEQWDWPALTGVAVLTPVLLYFVGVRWNGYVNICDCFYDQPLLYMIASLAGSVWVLTLGRLVEKTPLSGACQWLGERSLPIFMIHTFFVWCAVVLYNAVTGGTGDFLPDNIWVFILGIAVYAVSVPFALAHEAVRKRIRKSKPKQQYSF